VPTTVIDTYSDLEMNCPAEWENGKKEARVIRFGDGERVASHPFTGEWRGSTFSLALSDVDRRFREQLASATDRFWTEPLTVRMTTRANRAALGLPYTVFVGPIIEVHPSGDLALELLLGDIVSQSLLSDQHQVPWRMIGDSFVNEATFAKSEALDPETPEPIIYGQHRRVDVDPPSPQGFQVVPTYLGIEDGYHVWMVAGHACADLPDVLVWTPDPDAEGLGTSASMLGDPDWLIPHDSAPAYEDRRSSTYGNDRRYTLIRGLLGNEDADKCQTGERTLTCFVDGVEPNGDGSGAVITDRIQQYKHFLINFVAHYGADSYQAGAWLTNPTWDVFGAAVPIVDEDSFDTCSAIGVERLPPDGYIGAGIIGAKAGDRSGVTRWIADKNRSSGLRFGATHLGRLRVFMLHPTAAIKAAAPLYTDALQILKGSFTPGVAWQDRANRIPFRTDFEHTSGVWKTVDAAEWGESIQRYGRVILGEGRDYPFAPGITMAYHLAHLEVLQRQHPPRPIVLKDTVGPNAQGDSLGYRDLGDYIRYRHFASVSDAVGSIRLMQIDKHQVLAGRREVLVEGIDCEDQIDFDAPPAAPEPQTNYTCETALVIEQEPFTPVALDLDTTDHPTDAAAEGLFPLPEDGGPPAPGIAYHAAWFEFTPWAAGTLFLTTVHSLYDTQIAVFTGECGALVLDQYNDNDGVLQTSVLEFPVTAQTYKILIAGYGPADGGSLTFGLYFTEPE
jgi:hypothetical protein